MRFFQCGADVVRQYREQFTWLNKLLLHTNYPEKIARVEPLTESDFAGTDKLIGYLEAGMGFVFAAQEGERICGYCHVYIRPFWDEKRLLFNALIVHPECRRQGIGRTLLNMSYAFAVEQHCDTMELFSDHNDAAARGLYLSEGFVDFRMHMTRPVIPDEATGL